MGKGLIGKFLVGGIKGIFGKDQDSESIKDKNNAIQAFFKNGGLYLNLNILEASIDIFSDMYSASGKKNLTFESGWKKYFNQGKKDLIEIKKNINAICEKNSRQKNIFDSLLGIMGIKSSRGREEYKNYKDIANSGKIEDLKKDIEDYQNVSKNCSISEKDNEKNSKVLNDEKIKLKNLLDKLKELSKLNVYEFNNTLPKVVDDEIEKIKQNSQNAKNEISNIKTKVQNIIDSNISEKQILENVNDKYDKALGVIKGQIDQETFKLKSSLKALEADKKDYDKIISNNYEVLDKSKTTFKETKVKIKNLKIKFEEAKKINDFFENKIKSDRDKFTFFNDPTNVKKKLTLKILEGFVKNKKSSAIEKIKKDVEIILNDNKSINNEIRSAFRNLNDSLQHFYEMLEKKQNKDLFTDENSGLYKGKINYFKSIVKNIVADSPTDIDLSDYIDNSENYTKEYLGIQNEIKDELENSYKNNKALKEQSISKVKENYKSAIEKVELGKNQEIEKLNANKNSKLQEVSYAESILGVLNGGFTILTSNISVALSGVGLNITYDNLKKIMDQTDYEKHKEKLLNKSLNKIPVDNPIKKTSKDIILNLSKQIETYKDKLKKVSELKTKINDSEKGKLFFDKNDNIDQIKFQNLIGRIENVKKNNKKIDNAKANKKVAEYKKKMRTLTIKLKDNLKKKLTSISTSSLAIENQTTKVNNGNISIIVKTIATCIKTKADATLSEIDNLIKISENEVKINKEALGVNKQ